MIERSPQHEVQGAHIVSAMKPPRDNDDALLRSIVEGTAAATGEAFFRALVENLATALDADGAWVTEYLEDSARLRALAFCYKGEFISGYEYDIAGTPCEPVILRRDMFHVPERVIELFPDDHDLPPLNAVSYRGAPLLDEKGAVLGHLAILDSRVTPDSERDAALFRIFAARASAELQRLHAEARTREREAQLDSILCCAMDAIMEFDASCSITQANPAAEALLGVGTGALHGNDAAACFDTESMEKLRQLMNAYGDSAGSSASGWVSGGLLVVLPDGGHCRAEATLSAHVRDKRRYYVLILRNIEERITAERRINALTAETQYLREEIRSFHNFDEIIGESASILRVLHQMKQVAPTSAAVLLLGETGTGKELVARGIHAASARASRAMIKLNCAAIPAALIESELFGHEKGAFTGATDKRVGRFVLADGSSIFLDEIGEMPVELQAKLLRVLQEGEVEPVGASTTIHVDVRIIAATHRDLQREVEQGRFREDLYYRLNVFPIRVPPLRERPEDIAALASHFLMETSAAHGRAVAPLTDEDVQLLAGWHWPGNIRELRNIIERAVITSANGVIDLHRVLPRANTRNPTPDAIAEAPDTREIFTFEQWRELERENLLRALLRTEWRISGPSGAAKLLGVPPTTLASRIKALGIRKDA
jgi:PAS domain S-box-containing protein